MEDKKKVIYVAIGFSVIIFSYLTWGGGKFDAHINNLGIAVTIIGFGITLYLLKEVVDLATINKELKEREIFKEKILHNLSESLNELKGYTDGLLYNGDVDNYAERHRITERITNIYKSDYLIQMKKVANISPGFNNFDKRFTEFYTHLKKSVFMTKNQTPAKNVVETVNGLTGSFLLEVNTYIEIMKENE